MDKIKRQNSPGSEEEFGELIKFTVPGFVGGLGVAAALDFFGFQRSPVGQWVVRTLSGEGESILEGLYAVGNRLRGRAGSLAEAYGWGKLCGMTGPWLIDWTSRAFGMDVYGVESFYIPYFYAMSDQIGANLSGYVFLQKQTGSFRRAGRLYFRHPVMVTSLGIIFLVPLGLFIARLSGFRPTTQILTAFETIAANLCWLPPLIGWWRERNQMGRGGNP
jgi:hypothetical protein